MRVCREIKTEISKILLSVKIIYYHGRPRSNQKKFGTGRQKTFW